ncbi:uncharacterized protein G2W53_040728 [Senna tora]|uniref:Uncharacterized protein n=1 Tax=Senna tora TaxID=362788 RepID=A0A834SIS0_9FABA|nr:uncharacterized protein G2W53_040728 [Senna tora]
MAANVVGDTPVDCTKDMENVNFAGVMTALQEIAKMVKIKADEQVNFATLGEFAVNKLARHSNVSIIFYDSHCIVQDQKTKNILIEGKVARNLYVVKKSAIHDDNRVGGCNAKSFVCNTENSACNAETFICNTLPFMQARACLNINGFRGYCLDPSCKCSNNNASS